MRHGIATHRDLQLDRADGLAVGRARPAGRAAAVGAAAAVGVLGAGRRRLEHERAHLAPHEPAAVLLDLVGGSEGGGEHVTRTSRSRVRASFLSRRRRARDPKLRLSPEASSFSFFFFFFFFVFFFVFAPKRGGGVARDDAVDSDEGGGADGRGAIPA